MNSFPTPHLTRLALVLALVAAVPAARAEPPAGQVLYVPVYSEVPFGNRGLNLALTATLSIRNIDRQRPVTVQTVEYFSSAGALLRSYLKQPLVLKPMAAAEFIVKEADRSGGISASFLVEWSGDAGVTPPYVEAIMVNSTYDQGVAFNSPARVLEERR